MAGDTPEAWPNRGMTVHPHPLHHVAQPPAAWACSVCRGSFQSHRFECRECGHSECSFCVDDSRPAIVNAAGQRARRVGDSFYCGLPGSVPKCCGGDCGPRSGCNCAACAMLHDALGLPAAGHRAAPAGQEAAPPPYSHPAHAAQPYAALPAHAVPHAHPAGPPPPQLPLAPPGFADMHPHLLLTSKGGRCSVCAKQLLQFEPTKACKPCSFVACAPCYNAKAGERSVRSRNAASTPGPQDGFMDYASGAIDLASSGLSAAGGFGAIKEAGKKVGDLFGQLAK